MVPNSLLISVFASGLLLGFILTAPFAPKIQEIKDFFRYRIGYWNMLIPIGIIIGTNAAAYSMLKIAGLALLGPLFSNCFKKIADKSCISGTIKI